jgi:hypothetical protein
MLIAVKVLLYIVAAHVFYNNGINPESNIMNFTVLMSCYVLIDMCSHFSARSALLHEIILNDDE